MGGCYSKPLDRAENPRDVGVLLYSGNFTDPKAVQDVINKRLLELGTRVEIGIKLKSVQAKMFTGVRMEKPFDKTFHRKEWMMIHLEADQSVLRSAKKWIYKMFNQKGTVQPGGLRYRFIPSNITMTKEGSKKKTLSWYKHKETINRLNIQRNVDILFLDEPLSPDDDTTLRQYLMAKKSKDGYPLVWNIDTCQPFEDDTGLTKLVVYHPEHETEIQALLGTLPAMVAKELGDKAWDWFTDEAKVRMEEEVRYDETTNTFVTTDDDCLDFLLAETTYDGQIVELPEDFNTEKPARMDDQSFVSFGTGLRTMQEKLCEVSQDTQPSSITGENSLQDQLAEMQILVNKLSEDNKQLRKGIPNQREDEELTDTDEETTGDKQTNKGQKTLQSKGVTHISDTEANKPSATQNDSSSVGSLDTG
jgi:hypothetical protein